MQSLYLPSVNLYKHHPQPLGSLQLLAIILLLIPPVAVARFQHSLPSLPHLVLQPKAPQLQVRHSVNPRLVNPFLFLPPPLSSGTQHRRQHLFSERLPVLVFFPNNHNSQLYRSKHPSGPPIMIHLEPTATPTSIRLSVLPFPLCRLPQNLLARNLFSNPVQRLTINKFPLITKKHCLNQLSKLSRARNLSGGIFQSGYHPLKFGDTATPQNETEGLWDDVANMNCARSCVARF